MSRTANELKAVFRSTGNDLKPSSGMAEVHRYDHRQADDRIKHTVACLKTLNAYQK